MEKIFVNVADLYGSPALYADMPARLFYALDAAFARGLDRVEVYRSDVAACLGGGVR